ncbi:MAG: hypothetical protein DRP08_07445, partial [Candidatus Aenigmatarchaeota archaeon]
FRLANISSFVYLAYYYKPNMNILQNSSSINLKYINILPHAFSMVYTEYGWVPLDTTIPMRKSGEGLHAVVDASVNTDSNMIIYAKVVNNDPNDYLLIYSPIESVQLNLMIDAHEISMSDNLNFTSNVIIYLFFIAMIVMLYIFSSKSL